jgi:hypothetical protein
MRQVRALNIRERSSEPTQRIGFMSKDFVWPRIKGLSKTNREWSRRSFIAIISQRQAVGRASIASRQPGEARRALWRNAHKVLTRIIAELNGRRAPCHSAVLDRINHSIPQIL